MTIAVVVDSNAQLPVELADRYGIEVVPLPVTIDGVDHLEGVDVDADSFYAHWANGHVPEVTTSQPSPAAFVAAYERCAAAGASEVLSIHISESMSGTLNSARLAAEVVDVPVRLVDSGTASFGIACCAWAAADAIAAGATLDAAAVVAERRATSLRTSFVVGVPRLTARSGRAEGVDVEGAAAAGVAVLAMSGGELSVLATVADLDAAVQTMVADTLEWVERSPDPSPAGLHVAIGTSDHTSRPVADGLAEHLGGRPEVAEIVHYRIGPSVGAHTGPGTAGLFCF